MKINGRFAVVGYAVTVQIIWGVNDDDVFIEEERIISFCLDKDFALQEYTQLTIDDILSEEEKDTVVEIKACLEVWDMSDSPNDFNRNEGLCKILN